MTLSVQAAQAAILALNSDDKPFVYEATPEGIVGRWKYADVKWTNILSAGVVDADYELRLSLDPEEGTWDSEETQTQTTAGIGPGGLHIEKSTFRGTQKRFTLGGGAALFSQSQTRQGTQEGSTYGYRLVTDEIKEPAIAVLEQAGWEKKKGFFGKLFGG